MHCPNCGRIFSEDDESCQRCGLPLETVEELDGLSPPPTWSKEEEERFDAIWERGRAIQRPLFQEPPSFFGAIKTCFVKFWSVDSRASRSEAWYWTLFIVLITLAYTGLGTYYLTKPIADAVAGNEVGESVKTTLKTGFWTLVIGKCVVSLLWLPTVAMWMRRFNDLNWPLWIALALCVLDFVLGMKFVSQLFPKPTDFGEALFIDAVRHIGTLTLLAINFKAGVPEVNAFGPPFKRLSKSGKKVALNPEESDEKT